MCVGERCWLLAVRLEGHGCAAGHPVAQHSWCSTGYKSCCPGGAWLPSCCLHVDGASRACFPCRQGYSHNAAGDPRAANLAPQDPLIPHCHAGGPGIPLYKLCMVPSDGQWLAVAVAGPHPAVRLTSVLSAGCWWWHASVHASTPCCGVRKHVTTLVFSPFTS